MRATRNLVIAAGLVAVAAAVYAFLPRKSNPKSAALSAREQAMQKLGEQLAKVRPGCKVLVLSNPFAKDSGFLDQNAQFERAGLRGLREGLGSGSSVTVVFPEIKLEYAADPRSAIIPPDCRTPLSFLVRPGSVDELADAHPECSVIVSLIGLPSGIDQRKIWTQEDPRCFALLLPDLRILGPPEKAVDAFQRGKILALVTEDTGGNPLIVTQDTVSNVLKDQPTALGY